MMGLFHRVDGDQGSGPVASRGPFGPSDGVSTQALRLTDDGGRVGLSWQFESRTALGPVPVEDPTTVHEQLTQPNFNADRILGFLPGAQD